MVSPLKNKIHPRRAITELNKRIPDGAAVKTLWAYSGDIEMALAQSGERKVDAHITQREVFNFWDVLSESSREVYELLLSKPFQFEFDDYHRLQDAWHRWPSPKARAALFFVLSTASEFGLASRGPLDTTYLNAISYSRIMTFKKPANLDFHFLEVSTINWREFTSHDGYTVLNAGSYHSNLFDYGKAIGPEEVLIDHKEVLQAWPEMGPNVLILYNYSPQLFEDYKDSQITMINEFGKPTIHQHMCKEVIIGKR
jgi:hypothetical protein